MHPATGELEQRTRERSGVQPGARSRVLHASARCILIHEFRRPAAGAWNDYITTHPDATLFHELGWKRAVERTFGHRPWYLYATRRQRIVGVLPMFQINSMVAGRLLVSLPYATCGGVVADDPQVAVALLSRGKALAARVGANSLELRSVCAADPELPIDGHHVCFEKTLPAGAAAVSAAMPRKARAAARRAAERHSLTVEVGPDLLPIVWQLYARSMRRLGSPNYPYRFFEELQGSMGRRCVCHLVRHEARPVAGLLMFLFRNTLMPYFAGLDERDAIYGLNQYMYLRAMKWGVARGFRRFDFGRSRSSNRGACDFKRHCGFEPRPLQYQTYVVPGHKAPDLMPDSPRWTAARLVWKRLPLPITRPLGSWIARSIPG